MEIGTQGQLWSWQAAGIGLFGILLFIVLVRRRFGRRLPPGPTPWPVLGNLPQLGPLAHQSFMELAQKYGPIMSLWLGSRYSVVVSSPELAEEFLKNHDVDWASRRNTCQGMIMAYGCASMGHADYGPVWRHDRKFFTLELVTAKRLQDFQGSRREEILRGVRNALEECHGGSKAASVDVMARKIGVNVVSRMMMNDGFLNEKAAEMKDGDFPDTIKDALKLFGAFYIPDFVPWLEGLVQRNLRKKMYEAAIVMDEFFQSILEYHREKLQQGITDGRPQDIVDALLTRPKDVDGRTRSESQMKATMQEIILAGTDTTATTIEWAMSELLRNRHILERVQEEIDQVVGRDRLVQESDLVNLPYLHAIIKETFRLHPVAPFLFPHVTSKGSEVCGYKFPPKTLLFVNIYAIQRDPKVWDEPLEFKPERFLNSKKDVHGQDFDLLPFGSGRRACPGKSLGLLQFLYAMAVLIQTCEWSLPSGLKPEDIDMEESQGLTITRRNPLKAIMTPRLPLQLIFEQRKFTP